MNEVAKALAIGATEALAKVELQDLTIEKLTTSPRMGALPGSDVQLALMRAMDGRPIELLDRQQMLFHFGQERLPSGRPRIVVMRTGVRAGKSLIAAEALLCSVLTCELRRDPEPYERPGPDGKVGVRPGELVRALIVSPRLVMSYAPMMHVIGTLQSDALKSCLVKATKTTALIRRPDGHEVELMITAASSGGANIRSVWLAGILFDEADFHDGEDAAVNLGENVRAAMPRLLPGAQALVVSSPWADTGEFHKMFTNAFGQADGRVMAFHSDSRSMNPTLSREDEEAERKRDPDNHAREYLAVPISSATNRFFSPALLAMAKGAADPSSFELKPSWQHFAGSDLGFRKNSSALAIVRVNPSTRTIELVHVEELRPEIGNPLKPSEVCKSFAEALTTYGCEVLQGDLHYADTAAEELAKHGIAYADVQLSGEARTEVFTELRRALAEGLMKLPDDPRLLKQFEDTKSKALEGGIVKVILPKHGALHGDVLVAIANAVIQALPALGGPAMSEEEYNDLLPEDVWDGAERGF